MTALAANKEIAEKGAEKIAHPCAVDIIYRGSMVKHNAAGYAAPCANEAGAKFAGIAYEYKDNSGGSAGDVSCKVMKKGIFNLLGAGFSQATVGEKVYATDDQLLTLTYAAGLQWVGVIVAHISSTQAWVKIDVAADGDDDVLGEEIALAEGKVLLGNSAGKAAQFDASGDTKMLVGNATTVTSVAMSGDATMDNAGAVTIAAAAVTESKLSAFGDSVVTAHRVWRGDFTFAATATGSHNIGTTLPDNAIITKAWYDVQTTVAGTGDDSSTIAITSGESANDLVTAVAIQTGTPYDAGIQACIPVGTAGTMFKTTGVVQPQLVVDVLATDANIASGALSLFIEYVVSV